MAKNIDLRMVEVDERLKYIVISGQKVCYTYRYIYIYIYHFELHITSPTEKKKSKSEFWAGVYRQSIPSWIDIFLGDVFYFGGLVEVNSLSGVWLCEV